MKKAAKASPTRRRTPTKTPDTTYIPVTVPEAELTLEYSSTIGNYGRKGIWDLVDKLNVAFERLAQRYLSQIEAKGRWKLEVNLQLKPNDIKVRVLKCKPKRKKPTKRSPR
jgi:hypothetical protein